MHAKARGLAAALPLGQMGLAGPGWPLGRPAGWVGPQARPNPVDRFSFFSEFIFNAKTNSRKV
jgi:hypothetical protein